MRTLVHDIRYGLRILAKKPGFTAAAVLTLTLGVGSTAVIFSVADGVLLRPLPFPESERLVALWNDYPQLNHEREPVSLPDFCDWLEQNRSFAQLAAYEQYFCSLAGDPNALRLRAATVSGEFFAALGVRPVLGRPLLPADDHKGAHRVVVMSYRLWNSRFGSDRSTVGQAVTLNGAGYTVVGIMPAGFDYPGDVDLWSPLSYEPPFEPSVRRIVWLRTVARLKPGVTLAQAQADMSVVAQRLAQQYPETNTGRGVLVIPLHEQIMGDVRAALLVLLAAVGCLLMIACTNVANLLLARAAGRRFTDADREDSRAAVIINKAMASRFWPDESPIGRRIRLVSDESNPDPPTLEIVGVVEDVRQQGLDAEVRSEIYLPYAQRPWRSCFLLVRSESEAGQLAAALRHEIREIDPNVALSRLQSMNQYLEASIDAPRFRAFLLTVFAILALLLAAAGIYGVTSYSVAQRARDFGIRLALGAQPKHLLKMAAGREFLAVLAGIGLGTVFLAALTQYLSSLLFGVAPHDILTFAAAALLCGSVALAACYVPSRRVMEVDPLAALRDE
jgi:hypothetical protein